VTTPTTVQVQIQLRADTAANWTAQNPTLLNNELALETDTKKLKVGNGSTVWNSLAYFPFVVSGGTVLGNLEIGTTGTLTFEGSTADGFETTLGVVNPTADRTINLPNQSGTVIVSGNASIVDADISASAEIAVSKLADGAARQLLQTDAAGTGVEWASNIDVPGTLDVTGAATFDSSVTIAGDLTVNGTTTNINTQNLVVEDKNIILADVTTPTDLTADGGGITLKGATDKTITWSDTTDSWEFNQPTITTGSSTAASFIPTSSTVPSNGVYLSGTNTVAVATNSTGRLFIEASGRLLSRRYSLPGAFRFSRAEGTEAAPTAVTATAVNMSLGGESYDGTAYRESTLIQSWNDGAPSSTSSPGYLIFCTTPSGTITSTERLRITSDGKLGLGTSGPASILHIKQDVASGNYQSRITLENTDQRTIIGSYYEAGVNAWSLIQSTNASETVASNLLLQPSGGRVGIGTTAPSGLIHLQGASIAETWYTATNTGGATWRVGTADTSSGLSGAYRIYDSTNSAARLLIDNTGKVGIGTTAPSQKLHVAGNVLLGGSPAGQWSTCTVAGDVAIQAAAPLLNFVNAAGSARFGYIIHDGTGGNIGILNQENAAITFGTNNSEKARIDSSGRLLVGTSSARANFDNSTNSAGVQFEGSDGFGPRRLAVVSSVSDGASGGNLILAHQKSGAVGGNTTLGDGDQIGSVVFQGNDGSEFAAAARIEAVVDGTPSANDMPGRIVLSTTADGASSPTERVRIGSNGNVNIGRTSDLAIAPRVSIENANYALALNTTTGGTNEAIRFYNTGTAVGSITTTGSATAYNTSSDYRLKENIAPLTGAADRLNQLQVHRFNFIADPDTTVDGFIAHEAQAVVPECVTGTKDEVDTDGNPVYQGIDQSKLVPLLTAALQEALAEIESLKARVTALEP
jgi:hypothetical protein